MRNQEAGDRREGCRPHHGRDRGAQKEAARQDDERPQDDGEVPPTRCVRIRRLRLVSVFRVRIPNSRFGRVRGS
jgi:hypothetical protein